MLLTLLCETMAYFSKPINFQNWFQSLRSYLTIPTVRNLKTTNVYNFSSGKLFFLDPTYIWGYISKQDQILKSYESHIFL